MISIKNQSGLTLIELLISLAIAGLLLGAMVMTFSGQSKSNNNQQDIVALQENLWASLQLMSHDIRMAGYDPTGKAGAQIQTATQTSFRATQDLNLDEKLPPIAGNPNEDVTYQFNNTKHELERSTDNGTNWQPVMNDVTNMDFEYEVITQNGALPWTWTWTTAPANLKDIRVVKVCIQGQTNRKTSIGSGSLQDSPPFSSPTLTGTSWNPGSNGYQRRMMCSQIDLRNMID